MSITFDYDYVCEDWKGNTRKKDDLDLLCLCGGYMVIE